MKSIEYYLPAVLFTMLFQLVLTFVSVDEILMCDHSNESYWAVLSCGAVYYTVQGGLTSNSVDQILNPDHGTTILTGLFIMLYNVVLTFESVDKILWCEHFNESCWTVLSCGVVTSLLVSVTYPGRKVGNHVTRNELTRSGNSEAQGTTQHWNDLYFMHLLSLGKILGSTLERLKSLF